MRRPPHPNHYTWQSNTVTIKADQLKSEKKSEDSATQKENDLSALAKQQPIVNSIADLISIVKESSKSEQQPAAVAILRKGFSDALDAATWSGNNKGTF